MIATKTVLGTGLALGLLALTSACAPTGVASRLDSDVTTLSTATEGRPVAAVYDVQRVDIVVPRNLRVSEANKYYPVADIVWRGEPRGDRFTQVEAIWREAADRVTAGMGQGVPVVVTVEVTRFHCLTEKTRYSVGGTHSLHFLLTVTNAATGEVIDGPRRVVADVKAAGGQKAIEEEARGLTQRGVVVNRLSEVLQRELAAPVAVPMATVETTRADSDLRLTVAPVN